MKLHLKWSPLSDIDFLTMTSPPPEKKAKQIVSREDLMKLTKEELVAKLSDLFIYADDLECKLAASAASRNSLNFKKSSHHHQQQVNNVDATIAAPPATAAVASNANLSSDTIGISQEERFRQQQLEASRRENVLVMRLTTKEQEVQDLLAQLEEMRAGVGVNGVRNMLLDPAVNSIFQHMKQQLQEKKDHLDQSLQELEAWKFTPDSKTGKRLMARCKTLIQENAELGNLTSSGRIAKMDNELSATKKVCEDLKSSQSDIDGFLVELEEDMEGMQTQIVALQRKISELNDDNRRLREQVGGCSSLSSPSAVLATNAVCSTLNEEQTLNANALDEDRTLNPNTDTNGRTFEPSSSSDGLLQHMENNVLSNNNCVSTYVL